ncbi:MAG: helix-hairpin-helix domain-containing protein [Bacteroidota bacterium]
MKLLEKISRKIGFTSTETNVLLFILIACFVGITLNIVKNKINNKDYLEFDYSREDSLFNAASGDPGMDVSTEDHGERKFDSQDELLNFRKVKPKDENSAKMFSSKRIIKINSASIQELILLPGLGEKTANEIVNYRNKRGHIKSINELLNVKGIGRTRLEKIKDLISLD